MKPRQELRELKNLYDLLPKADIKCVDGCAACCGPVPATRMETRAAPRLAEINTDPDVLNDVIHSMGNCGVCPYVQAKGYGCAIYDQRPFLCRMFGLVKDEPKMACRHGLRTTKPLSRTQATKLLDRYLKIYRGAPGKTAELAQITENWLAACDRDGLDYL